MNPADLMSFALSLEFRSSCCSFGTGPSSNDVAEVFPEIGRLSPACPLHIQKNCINRGPDEDLEEHWSYD